MKRTDYLILGLVGLGAYALYKKQTESITNVVDSIKVPLIYTQNKTNEVIKDFSQTYNSINTTSQQVSSGLLTWLNLTSVNPIKQISTILGGLKLW